MHLTFVQIISKLEGHSKRVSDLAFSISFDLLVSIGVNDEVSIFHIYYMHYVTEGDKMG